MSDKLLTNKKDKEKENFLQFQVLYIYSLYLYFLLISASHFYLEFMQVKEKVNGKISKIGGMALSFCLIVLHFQILIVDVF